MIQDGPKPDCWRNPTDNDYGFGMPSLMGLWKEVTDTIMVSGFCIKEEKNKPVEIHADLLLTKINAHFKTIYTIDNNGEMVVDNSLILAPNIRVPNMPRVGSELVINKSLENVKWYGRGPHENYIDRKTSAFIGQYHMSVDELRYDYIRPQENGYRTDVRWVSFDNGKAGLFFHGSPVLNFNAQYFSKEDYKDGKRRPRLHPYEMQKRGEIYLNIDYKQMGVGGDNSWRDQPHEIYQIIPHEYYYTYKVVPFSMEQTKPCKLY